MLDGGFMLADPEQVTVFCLAGNTVCLCTSQSICGILHFLGL